MPDRLGDSSVFGLSTFGFALAVLGTQLTLSSQIAGATVYAVLVAAIGETLAGLWALARGDGYLAGVLTTFGVWLIGYYFFLTAGRAAGLVTAKADGVYVLLLVIPLAYDDTAGGAGAPPGPGAAGHPGHPGGHRVGDV